MSAYQVLLFYKYTDVDAPEGLAARVRALATDLSLTGRVIVAHEGINATLEGTVENTEKFVSQFLTDKRFADVQIKRSAGTGKSFPNLKVKVRDEMPGRTSSELHSDDSFSGRLEDKGAPDVNQLLPSRSLH